MADIAALLQAAEAERGGTCKQNWVKYYPVIAVLRKKGKSYQEIFDWLISKGEPLKQSQFDSFRASYLGKTRSLLKTAQS